MSLFTHNEDAIEFRPPYSAKAGIIGRFFRLCWAPIAYILGIGFKL